MKQREIAIHFPVAGLDRSASFQTQAPYSTPDALNIFPVDPPSGRARGGVRPVLYQLSTLPSSAVPYHAVKINYLDSGTKDAMLVCTSQGTYTTLDMVTFTERIATNPTSDFSTCAYFNGFAYQAVSGASCRQIAVPSGAEAVLSNAGGGTAPTNCGLVWVHQGRLALAGKSDGAHQMFMSASGDATNWDYTLQTVGGAWANTGTYAGAIGDIIVAAIAYDRNISYIGSPRSIYGINGNPRVGGTIPVSDTIGPLMNNAWCRGRDANGGNCLWMMTYDGLYMQPGGFGEPIAISRKKIPNELIGVDPSVGDKCAIGYDSRWPGVHITIDPNTGSDVNYFYHVPTDSWWPLELPITPHVYATFPKLQTDDRSAIIPIGSAGSVRQYDNAELQGGANEDFDSYVWIGPIQLASPGGEGILHAISAALAKDSENVNWSIHVGDSAEEAFNSTAAFTGSAWTYASSQYWNYWQHPRVRGNCFYIKLFDQANERWLIEEIVARIQSHVAIRRVG